MWPQLFAAVVVAVASVLIVNHMATDARRGKRWGSRT